MRIKGFGSPVSGAVETEAQRQRREAEERFSLCREIPTPFLKDYIIIETRVFVRVAPDGELQVSIRVRARLHR